MRVLFAGVAVAALSVAGTTSAPQVTFYKDVLPVLQKNCQSCHRAGEVGPMQFTSYESTRPWAKAIKAAVASKTMPPWFADPAYGHFANDRTLSAADIKTLVSWAENDAPAGNPKDAPKPVQFADGWAIGKPDMVFEIPNAVSIPSEGTIDYQYVVMHSGFTEDRYVQLAEARPSDREHCHHIIAFIREPGSGWMKDAPIGVAFVPQKNKKGDGGGGSGDFLAGYAPGTIPETLKPGQAKLIKAGSDIVFQLHYTANGKAGSDKSRVGVVFSTSQPTERVVTLAATNPKFAIPAGDPNYRVDAKVTLQEDSTLVQMLPHMHLRGKAFDFRVTYPDGRQVKLLNVPHYSFSWQLSYYPAEPIKLPAGSTIECTGYYDNSANNKFNPDPTKEIHFGEQSWDEMMFGFYDVVIPAGMSLRELFMPAKTGAPANTGP
jgi:mono/diheme cytochrome c family protein